MTHSRQSGADERIKFLVTVKTYPTPSIKYTETVCTGGVTEDRRWIRLYPVPFRYWHRTQQYRLYDWVELAARKRPPGKDKRKESYEPAGDLKVVGHVGTEHNWQARRQIVLPLASGSIEALLDAYDREWESLGIIKPAQITDVEVQLDDTDWSPQHRALFRQMRLFGPQVKSLERPHHRFYYCFRCNDSRCDRPHRMQILDWGLSYLYLKTWRKEGEAAAVRKTKDMCWHMVAEDKDSYFYVGTIYPKRSFTVLGVFYPKKER